MRKNKTLLLLFTLSMMLVFQAAAAHSYYDSLIEADFLGNGLKFEAADLDTLCVDKQTYLQIETTPSLPEFPDVDSFEVRLSFEIPASSPAQSASVLRC
jgi:hypothetical protein